MPSTLVDPFVGYTLEDARAKILRKLRVNNTTRYSPTQGTADYAWIDDCLNVAQRKFAIKTRCLRSYAIVEMKNGYRTYRAPKGFIDILGAYYFKSTYANGYEKLQIKTTAELDNEVSDWKTDTDDDIEAIYIDRFYGTDSVLGVYPIPTADGSTTYISADTGSVYDWVCPLYTYGNDFGTVVKADGTDKYVLAEADSGVIADMDVGSGNILLEFYRLPMDLSDADQLMEIPYAYQDTVIDDAARQLLEDNPEDSAEFKRSALYGQRVDKEVQEYKANLKKPYAGRELKVRTAVEGWQKNMDWRKGMF